MKKGIDPRKVIHGTATMHLGKNLDTQRMRFERGKRNAILLILLLLVTSFWLALNYINAPIKANTLIKDIDLMADMAALYVLLWLVFVGQRFFFLLLLGAAIGWAAYLGSLEGKFPPKPGAVMTLVNMAQGDDLGVPELE